MQIEKTMINDGLPVSTESSKFVFSTIDNLTLTFPWSLLFFKKVTYFLTISIIFSVYNQNVPAQ